MKYLGSEPMVFSQCRGETVKRDPAKCSHTRKLFKFGQWKCADCGVKIKEEKRG